ncbi:GNAT family N-acetyltransferase [Micromonospora sp. WMMD1120]|uniref:GNAT family N-acetyltransferase n=1 Tax=Micromonospora sp. WMMD1120 TaxID=3016106 RepID=UPI002415D112|nr:GNAT family N-acetyltransferase [Micromonospora sp. WMMD1120]MDG4806967.1 GNAT family N-acetyltransferase [Micromonospora sp. WMMD1120]
MDGDVSVTALRSIREIGERVWNDLAEGEGFYSGYPWLAWAETDPSFVTTYLVARDASGAIVAAVATYLWNGASVPSMNLAYSPGHIAEENLQRSLSAEEHAAFLPALLVGSRAGYHGAVAISKDLPADRRDAVLTALFVEVEALAARLGAACVALLYTPVAHVAAYSKAWHRAVGPAGRGPVAAMLSAEAVLPAPGGDRTVEAADRREWRRERRRYDDAVDRVETVRLAECVDVIAPLLGATQRKYGGPDSDADMRRYFASQVPALDAYSLVLLEFAGDEAVGFSLNYLWPDGVYVRAAGFGQRAAAYSYFNLTMYRPRDLAAERGLPGVHLGAGTYGAKRARGAEPRWTAGLVRPPADVSDELTRAFAIDGSDYRQAVRIWGGPAPTIPSQQEGDDALSEVRPAGLAGK